MVNDGDFPTKSRKVPPANSALNFFQEEVLGNKTDTAVTSPGTTKSVVAMAKGSLTNEATILAAVLAVQNNTRFVAAVPTVMELPLAGDVAHMIAANLYDDVGHMEDPDNEEILVRVFDAAGAYVTAALYDDLALTTPCSVATDQVNFPTASGWRVIPKIAVGKYIFYFKVSTTSTVQALLFEFGYDEGGNIQSQYRPSYIGDEDTMVADIYADTQAIITLIGTPVTDLATDIADCDAQVVTSEGVVTAAITASEIALTAEIDANEAKIDLLQIDTTAIIADLDNATDGLGALKTEIDANETKIDLIQVDTTAIIADLDNATDGLGALKTEIDANETKIDLLQVDTTAILVDTGAIKAVSDLLPDGGALTSLAQDLTVAKEATLGVPVGASLSADIAAIPLVTPDAAGTAAGLLAVPAADSALNVIATDVIGNKTDTVLGDSLVAMSKSITLGVSLVKAVTDVLPDAGALTSIAQEATLATVDGIVDSIKTQTDKLAGATPGVGTATQNWNAAEANIVSIGANDTKTKIHSLFVSLHALTVGATITIRMYTQINGVERQFYKNEYVIGMFCTDGQLLIDSTMGVHEVVRVTAQSDNVNDDGLGIDYDYLTELM